MKSIAILYASEGTGHRIAAENLRDRFLQLNPEGHVLCRDILEYIPSWLHWFVSYGYLFMARSAPWAWGWFYWGSDKKSFESKSFDIAHDFLCRLYLPRVERDISAAGAEAVFFTHYFGAANLARRNAANFPTFYVGTDFITHRFQRSADFCYSFTASPDAVAQYHTDNIENVCDCGIPIAPKFSALPSKMAARAKLGITADRKVVLVSGGGIGAGSVEKAVASLAGRKEWLTVVICGSNKKLQNSISRRYKTLENIRTEGFVSDMEDYYRAADLGIMKPGGLSLSEALASGLPLLLMDPIPGQEQLNMDYVCAHGAAIVLKDARMAADKASELLNDSAALLSCAENSAQLSRADAAGEILHIAEEKTRAYKTSTR
jgi:processive 1,2-diacylglycerol beta-glucosyltransferase